jgi:hypothetical protein
MTAGSQETGCGWSAVGCFGWIILIGVAGAFVDYHIEKAMDREITYVGRELDSVARDIRDENENLRIRIEDLEERVQKLERGW